MWSRSGVLLFETLPKLLKKDFDEIKDELQILSPKEKELVGVINLNKQIQTGIIEKGQPLFKREARKGLSCFFEIV